MSTKPNIDDEAAHYQVVPLIEELGIEGAIVPNRRGELYRLAAAEIDRLSRELAEQKGALSDDMPKWREALVKISILDHERDPLAAYLAVNVACTALGIEPLDGSSSWVKCDKCYRVAQSRDLEGQRCGDTLTHNDPGCGGTMRPHREATK